jgi:hypothetical protein
MGYPDFLNKPHKRGNPEGQMQLQIIHYCRVRGYKIGKTKTTGIKRGRSFCFDPYTFRGFPDLTCFANNKLYFIEVKSPKGEQTPEQMDFEGFCKQANIPYILARNLEDVQEIIK